MTEKINWQSALVLIRDLKDFDKNPRRMSKKDYDRLVKDLKTDGYHKRILVTQDNIIIGGHSRKKALLEAGFKINDRIEVLKASRELTEEEYKRINIKDNLGFGEFDMDILASDYDTIDLLNWGMTDAQLGLTDIEKVSENKKEEEKDENHLKCELCGK